jgi:hypothetical protein
MHGLMRSRTLVHSWGCTHREEFRALWQRAAQSPRKVRVIARLSQAAVSGGRSDVAAEVRGETVELQAARERLATRLKLHGVKALDAIHKTGFVVLEVNAAELEQLVIQGEVSDLYEDVALPLTLVANGPWVDGPEARAMGATGLHHATGWRYAVAILDNGVESSHPFLGGRVVAGPDPRGPAVQRLSHLRPAQPTHVQAHRPRRARSSG